MPTYQYHAKQGPTQKVEGELQAESHAAALTSLAARGLVPVWVREKSESASAPAPAPQSRGGRVPPRQITVLTRQLGSLIKAGVPILRALRTLREQADSGRLAAVVGDIEAQVRDGGMLSAALKRFPRLFSPLYVDMVAAGESGGILEVTLARLAEAREQEEDMRRKVQAATAYPVVVLVVGLLTIFVLLTFFLPKIVAMYSDVQDLPLPTRILIAVSGFFAARWPWLLLFLGLGLAVYRRLVTLERGRRLIDGLLLRLPLVGRFLREAEIARFTRTLSLLLDAGIPIDRALALSAHTLTNLLLRDDIERVRVSTVQQGATLSEGLRRSRAFPMFVSNMTAVGEESGSLDAALMEVARFYEKAVEQQARLATSLIEPILILVVGAVVGFIVAAMLLPVFELGTGL